MRFLKRIISVAAALLTLSMAVLYCPYTVMAEESSPLDVRLTIETKEINIKDIPEDGKVYVEIYVDKSPAFSAMTLFFDVDNRLGLHEWQPIKAMDGVENLLPIGILGTEDRIFGGFMGAKRDTKINHTGAIAYLVVFIPKDAKVGDFYKIDFTRYAGSQSMSVAMGNKLTDRYGEESFTRLNNGGILITGDEPTTTTPTSTTTTTTEPTTTTTTTTTTTATEPPTTTTTTTTTTTATEPTTTTTTTTTEPTTTTTTTTTTLEKTTTTTTTSSEKAEESTSTASTTIETVEEDDNNSKNIWLVVLIICVIAVGIIIVIIIKSKSKKK